MPACSEADSFIQSFCAEVVEVVEVVSEDLEVVSSVLADSLQEREHIKQRKKEYFLHV